MEKLVKQKSQLNRNMVKWKNSKTDRVWLNRKIGSMEISVKQKNWLNKKIN